MLPRHFRLSESRTVEAVWKRGHTCSHDALRFRFFQTTRASPRIAVVVSLKVSKRAVVRNRLKRQIHAILAPLMPRLSYPVDGILAAQPGLERRTFQELSTIILVLLKRARLLAM